jgi:hypothetical protein
VSVQRRVFLHVGCPKTGTTFLQSTMWKSRDRLLDAGLELPVDRVSHFQLALAVREQLIPDVDTPRVLSAVDRMTDALKSSTSSIVLSNEMLAGATREQADGLHRLLAETTGDAEVHLVVTARDLARQVPAEWQQQIQHRRTISWPDFLQSLVDGGEATAYFLPAQDASDVARRWADDLPPERVHVVTVPRRSAPREQLLTRFCAVLGVDPELLSEAAAVPNESLGLVSVELLRRVNVALGDRLPHPRSGYGRVGKRYFAQQVLAPLGGRRPTVPAQLRSWCLEQSDRIVESIAAGGYDVVGDLEELRPDFDSEETPAEVNDTEVAAYAIDALADLLQQRHQDLRLIDDLRAQLKSPRGSE